MTLSKRLGTRLGAIALRQEFRGRDVDTVLFLSPHNRSVVDTPEYTGLAPLASAKPFEAGLLVQLNESACERSAKDRHRCRLKRIG
jgi:hypothetical protein